MEPAQHLAEIGPTDESVNGAGFGRWIKRRQAEGPHKQRETEQCYETVQPDSVLAQTVSG